MFTLTCRHHAKKKKKTKRERERIFIGAYQTLPSCSLSRRCITVNKLMAMNVWRCVEERYLDNSRNRLGKLAQLSDRYNGADRMKHDKRYCKYNYYHQTFSNRSWVDQSATVDGQASVLLTHSIYHWRMRLRLTWWTTLSKRSHWRSDSHDLCSVLRRQLPRERKSIDCKCLSLTNLLRFSMIYEKVFERRVDDTQGWDLSVDERERERKNEEVKYETASSLPSSNDKSNI